MSFKFKIENTCDNARAGLISTDNGKIETPIFMPVGTKGTVKAIHQRELEKDIKAQIILGNTYHLYFRPNTKVLKKAKGLHNFINWKKPILTDSGGYQVYSLSHRRKLTEEGVEFSSHIDGSKHMFSPEKSMQIQREIGADIIMAFDECIAYPSSHFEAKKSLELTIRWLKRCIKYLKQNPEIYSYKQTLFPIVQGSTFKDLREYSAKKTIDFDAEGYAIGGLSVGEPHKEMYDMTSIVCDILPKQKPRYLMGVGTPANILESISRGVDMFDCVMPTRNGRNGMLFTWDGIINIKNKIWENNFSAIDDKGTTFVDKNYSKAYLRHLFKSNEILASQIASIHNLGFYMDLVKTAREKIKSNEFSNWIKTTIPNLNYRIK